MKFTMLNYIGLFLAIMWKITLDWDDFGKRLSLGPLDAVMNPAKSQDEVTYYSIGLYFSIAYLSLVLIYWRTNIAYMSRKMFIYELRTSQSSSTATELLSMLMPKFVIDRITSFSTYGLSIADEAGYCTILFCDIDDFDSVVSTAQKGTVQILDELWRNFDRLCQKYGVQKIEAVGKTYMAAGGLKFVEER